MQKNILVGKKFGCNNLGHAIALLCIFGSLLPAISIASVLGDGIAQLGIASTVKRTVQLRDLGVTEPVVLAGTASQDFYLPVPYGVPLLDATIDFEGHYIKGVPGNTSVVLSLNGVPSASQTISGGNGELKQSMVVPPSKNRANFVRLGVNWRNQTGEQRCDENYSQANSITISPQTRLTYKLAVDSIRSVEQAWSALPANVTLLVAAEKLDQQSFDSAWRIGTALLRSGKRIQLQTFPSVGDSIDLKELSIPVGLAANPIFASLAAARGTLKVTNLAQIGALILLSSPVTFGDIVLADKALQERFTAALDALQKELSGDVHATEVLKQIREKDFSFASRLMPSKEISVLAMGKQRVLAIAADAGGQLAGLQETGLQRLLSSNSVSVPIAKSTKWDEAKGIRLSTLGGGDSSFDVLARGDWTVNFPLSTVSSQGKIPVEITLYLAAAPGASSTKPVASVFWNGVLLSAKQLDANGSPEELRARVPSYALGVNNTLRVAVQRQPYSADCNEIPQAYPASVLPAASYLVTGNARPDGTFVGLLPLLGGSPQLWIPESYLSRAKGSVERIASIAAASGLSASQAELAIAKEGSTVKPTKPFLSMDVAFAETKAQFSVKDGKQVQIQGKDIKWLDISGLSQLSAAEVVASNGQSGIFWQTIGDWSRGMTESFLLNRGNIAVLGDEGPVVWIDSSNPESAISSSTRRGAFYEWRDYISWSIPVIVIAVFILLLLSWLAWRAGQKNQAKH